MSTLYDYCNTGANSQDHFYGIYWSAQTFTASQESYTLTSVKLLLFRVGSPGTITVHLRNVSDNVPTGDDLVTGTIDGNTLTTDPNGAWYEITFSSPYTLTIGTKYAIVVDAAGGTATNRGDWRKGPGGYLGGSNCYSSDSGSSWIAYATYNMFECWGVVSYDPSTTIKNGVQGCWYLDDNLGNTVVQDASPAGNTGTSSRNTNLLSTAGKVNKAFDCDQSLPDNVDCGDINNIDLSPNQDIAIALWMKRGTIQAGKLGTLLHKFNSVTSTGYSISCDDSDDQIWVDVLFPTQYQSVISAGIDIDTWTFVVVNVNRDEYLTLNVNNGVGINQTNISSYASTDASNSTPLYFGKSSNINANYDDYDGLLDEVAVWNRLLTLAEINYLYNSGAGRHIAWNVAPTITDQSGDTTVNEEGTVDLFVTATGSPDPSYEWYFNDVLIPGETNSTLSFTASRTDAGTYKCRAYNVAGEDWSDPIVLTVQYLEITSQPSDTTVPKGQQASFSLVADGVPAPTYQWYKGVQILAGETNPTLAFYCVFEDAGSYRCKVTNAYGTVWSDYADLTVVANPYTYRLLNNQLDQERDT